MSPVRAGHSSALRDYLRAVAAGAGHVEGQIARGLRCLFTIHSHARAPQRDAVSPRRRRSRPPLFPTRGGEPFEHRENERDKKRGRGGPVSKRTTALHVPTARAGVRRNAAAVVGQRCSHAPAAVGYIAVGGAVFYRGASSRSLYLVCCIAVFFYDRRFSSSLFFFFSRPYCVVPTGLEIPKNFLLLLLLFQSMRCVFPDLTGDLVALGRES